MTHPNPPAQASDCATCEGHGEVSVQASDEPMRAAMDAHINGRTQALAKRLESLGISNLGYTAGPDATRAKLIAEINRVLDRFDGSPATPQPSGNTGELPPRGAEEAPEALTVAVHHNPHGATVIVSIKRGDIVTQLYAQDHEADCETLGWQILPMGFGAASRATADVERYRFIRDSALSGSRDVVIEILRRSEWWETTDLLVDAAIAATKLGEHNE